MNKQDSSHFYFGHSGVGRMASTIDWAKHDFGAVETWSQSFKTSLSIVLNSKFPMFISWGKERWFFYNDAYAIILGNKHPNAFGNKFYNIWPEIWDSIEPFIVAVDQGESVYQEDLKLIMNRFGKDEETYFTFSYSPIQSESNEIEGLFCAVVETSDKVFAMRETKIAVKLRDDFLSIASHELKTPLTALKLQSQIFKKILNGPGLNTIEKVKEFSGHVEKQTARLTRLIDDMLDISRMRTGKLTIQKERTDLCILVKDVIQRMENQFSSSGYSLPVFDRCDEVYGEWDILRLERSFPIYSSMLLSTVKAKALH